MIGIYKISNTIDNRVYIGSSCNIRKRMNEHKNDLRRNRHHCIHLQRFFNKNGIESLVFEVIEECEQSELLIIEQKYLNKTKPLFNVSKSAHSPMLGYKHTEETKRKISQPGSKNPMFGKKRPKELIDKLREMSIGRLKTNAEKRKRIINLPNRTPVIAFNNAILIEEESMTEMARVLKVAENSISRAIKKGYLTRGFKIQMIKSLTV